MLGVGLESINEEGLNEGIDRAIEQFGDLNQARS